MNNFVDVPTTVRKQVITGAYHIANNFILCARQYDTQSPFQFCKILLVNDGTRWKEASGSKNKDKPDTQM